jgi:ATP-dependent Clp protease ATP-binding subunit ClpA
MFKRYTEEAKSAIFFAQQVALYKGAEALDPSHLLIGLLAQKECRSNKIFGLGELLPDDAHVPADRGKWTFTRDKTVPLSKDGKCVLVEATREANRLGDYWIHAEHLILGIFGEGNTATATKLREVGLELRTCRELVIDNRNSQPQRHEPVLWWPKVQTTTLGIALQLAFLVGIILAMVLLRNQ